jgi:DNA-binding LacI/PurR family transcriptional regulator
MPVTLYEIAAAAGVSVSTVSRALSNSRHTVNEDTRRRILAVAEELGYRPNMFGRGLRTDRSYTVGIIADNISSAFTPLIIRGINDHLKQHRYLSIIIDTDWDPQQEHEAVTDLLSRSIDGVIFVESLLRGPNPSLDLEGKPYVFVHRLFAGAHRNSVVVDDLEGARLAVNHLLALGHCRIAHIAGPEEWVASTDRLRGYGSALEQAGIDFTPGLVVKGDWEIQSGYQAAQVLFAGGEKAVDLPTALFAANDLMALGAIYALQARGVRVPQDVAVAGYDDRDIAALVRPTITTVTMPCYRMGQESAKLLLSLLEGQEGAEDPIRVCGRLVVRESCGAASSISPAQFETHTTPYERIDRRRPPGGRPAA